MKKNFFLIPGIIFSLSYSISADAQTHDISFKVGQAFKSTSKEPVDSRLLNSKSGRKGFGFDLGYGYYFRNDNYIKLCGSYSSTTYFSDGTNDWGTSYREMHYDEKAQSYGANLEFGKRLNYKFIDFLAGVGAGFYKAPPHAIEDYYFMKNEPGYPYPFTQSESRTVTTVPGAKGANLYLNTALYFKIWKPFYIGVEVSNGVSYTKQKGDQTAETLSTYSNGTSYIVTDQKYVEETSFNLQLFRTQLALRFFFGTKKTVKAPEQTP